MAWHHTLTRDPTRGDAQLQPYFSRGMYSAPDAKRKGQDLLRLLEMWKRVRQTSAKSGAEPPPAELCFVANRTIRVCHGATENGP